MAGGALAASRCRGRWVGGCLGDAAGRRGRTPGADPRRIGVVSAWVAAAVGGSIFAGAGGNCSTALGAAGCVAVAQGGGVWRHRSGDGRCGAGVQHRGLGECARRRAGPALVAGLRLCMCCSRRGSGRQVVGSSTSFNGGLQGSGQRRGCIRVVVARRGRCRGGGSISCNTRKSTRMSTRMSTRCNATRDPTRSTACHCACKRGAARQRARCGRCGCGWRAALGCYRRADRLRGACRRAAQQGRAGGHGGCLGHGT